LRFSTLGREAQKSLLRVVAPQRGLRGDGEHLTLEEWVAIFYGVVWRMCEVECGPSPFFRQWNFKDLRINRQGIREELNHGGTTEFQ
jgi:hypothetical protein